MTKKKKAIFNKSGKYYSVKVCIPVEWANFLGITEEDPSIKISLENNTILIKKDV